LMCWCMSCRRWKSGQVRSVGHVGSSKGDVIVKGACVLPGFQADAGSPCYHNHRPSVLHVIHHSPPAHQISQIAIQHHAYGKCDPSDYDRHKADLETRKSAGLAATPPPPEDDSGSARSRWWTWCEPVVVSGFSVKNVW
jgi:hypothetical protein